MSILRFGELFREIWHISTAPIRLPFEYPLEHLILIAPVIISAVVLMRMDRR